MSTSILTTKFYVPPARRNAVARPRLHTQLDGGLQQKLTLIAAPAGYGKTTLVSAWVATSGRPVAWLSLGEEDNDLNRFLTYLVSALQTIAPQVGRSLLATLQSPQPPALSTWLPALVNDIATLPESFVLILDDYHLIDAKVVDQALAFLIDHLPPHMHLVITTREDPQLPLARLRARGELNEIRAADLRFTPDEATAFLNQTMNLNLSTEEVAALESRTEGWIAGLQLAALSMRGRKDVAGFIQAFAGDNRHIVDYLVEEVLQRQPEPLRNFLLRTSILDRLCGALCDALVERLESGEWRLKGHNLHSPLSNLQSQTLLEQLERSNLFVIPLDDRRHWFRYHHLFAELLHSHLLEQLPDQVPLLHRRASEWYEEQGILADAIRHAFAAADLDRAARLIEREWRNHHRSQFRSAAVIDWMKRLPEAMVRASPSLSTGYAWELLNQGELEAAESHLRDAEQRLTLIRRGDVPSASVIGEEQMGALQVDIASARAYLAQSQDDLPGALVYAQRAIDLCPPDDHLARALMEALVGLVVMANGDLAGAYRSMTAAQRGVQQAGNVLFAIGMTYSVADIQIAQGQLRGAIRTYEEALALAGVNDRATTQAYPMLQGTADLYLGLSDLHHELGHWAEARHYLQKSEELGARVALPNWPYRLRLVQARMKEREGDLTGALRLLEDAAHWYYPAPVPEVRPLAAMKAQIWIRQGQLLAAQAWVRERGLSSNDALSFRGEFEHITLARLLIATYQHQKDAGALQQATGLLTRLLLAAEAGERLHSVIEIRLLQALAQHSAGDTRCALIPLEHALTLAEPEGYVRIFVMEGAAIRQLLSAAQARQIAPGYVERLLTAFAPAMQQQSTLPYHPTTPPPQPFGEPLSVRELEVLVLIAQGCSNQEIGARLFLALDTVKGHNRRIFEKLQVQRRTEAVARARELGLL